MPRIAYIDWNPRGDTLRIIEQANAICAEYRGMGLDLTLRQLYYQFVARDIIPNRQTEYKRLGGIVDNARKAGLLDWTYIVDLTRDLRGGPGADLTVPEYIYPDGYTLNHWRDQPSYVEVWVEKDALRGVVAQAVSGLQVAYFACRGYPSQSEVWGAAQRLRRVNAEGRRATILHLGDHDPSGIDMTRDIDERLMLFGARVDVKRIALNMEQVEQYDPPPNPAKDTDARFQGYADTYGDESWELDALEPRVLIELIRDNIAPLFDLSKRHIVLEEQAKGRGLLRAAQDHWEDIVVPALEDEAVIEIEDPLDQDAGDLTDPDA